jgi:hypothetical protein
MGALGWRALAWGLGLELKSVHEFCLKSNTFQANVHLAKFGDHLAPRTSLSSFCRIRRPRDE